MMRFEGLTDALDEIALHLRLEGRGYQANQYRKASESVMKADFIPSDPAQIDNVGETIRDDIAEYRAYGKIERLEEMREKRPYLSELVKIDGLGPKTAEKLAHEGIDSIEKVASADDLTTVEGIGQKTADKFRESAKELSQ